MICEKSGVPVVLTGISHLTAPVGVREKLHAGLAARSSLRADLIRRGCLRELVLVSTCNRLEVYAVPARSASQAEEDILEWLADAASLSIDEVSRWTYRKRDIEAIQHLLRVACGLDSQMLGETQILGQVSQAIVDARSEATVGPLLTGTLTRAVHAGKRARTETAIACGVTSIMHAAAALVERELDGLSSKRVMVVGAGQTAELVIQALHKRGEPDITCIGRSVSRASAIALPNGCAVLPWSALAEALVTADAVITATSAPHPILFAEDLASVLGRRGDRRLVLVDIAVPRDVDPRVGELSSVVLYDIDQLEQSLDEGRACREAAAPRVEEIVSEETLAILEWLRGRQVAPVIQKLRGRARAIAGAEAREAVRRLDGMTEKEHEVILRMARRIVGKILHEPTVGLKVHAGSGKGERYVQAVVELFGLDAETDGEDAGVALRPRDPESRHDRAGTGAGES